MPLRRPHHHPPLHLHLRLCLILCLLLLLLLLRPQQGQIPKPLMSQRVQRTDPHLRPQLQHTTDQIQTHGVDLRQEHAQVLRGVDVEITLVFRELGDSRPGALGGGAHDAEDLLQLVFVGGSREEGPSRVHLRHDAARGPDVDTGVVGAGAEEDVRGAVPQRDDLVGEGVDGDAERAGQTKIREFQLALDVDEEVLGLEVAVQDAVFVAEGDALEELVHEGFDGDVVELAAGAPAVHVFFEVFVHVFEDEHEFVFRVDDVVQGDDVFVLELFHEGDFADGCAGGAFFAVEVDFFEGDQFSGLSIASLEDLNERKLGSRGTERGALEEDLLLHMFPHPARILSANDDAQCFVRHHTFSSCWKELGCLLSMPALVKLFCLFPGLWFARTSEGETRLLVI